MDTSLDRARVGLASAKTRHGLTEAKLRELVPGARAYEVSDGGNGLYVVVSPSGSRSFRYDYRLGGRRETLTIGRHEPVARHSQRSHLAYGMDVTLEEARLLLARARVDDLVATEAALAGDKGSVGLARERFGRNVDHYACRSMRG